MIALDPFTTPGDTVWPQLGRGGFMRNANGAAVISHPDGGKRTLIYKGASAWWPFAKSFDGVEMIYAYRGTWVHSLCDMLDRGEEIPASFTAEGVELGIPEPLQDHIAKSWQAFRKTHSIDVHAIEQAFVGDGYKVASNTDRIVSIGGGGWCGGDIKTSREIQTATYAAQLAMIPASKMYDPTTGERSDWAQPITETGYIFWFPLSDALKADGPDGWPDWSLIRVDLTGIVETCDTLAAIRDAGTPDCFTTVEPAADAAADRMAQLKARYADLNNADRTRFVDLDIDMKDADAVEAGLNSVDPFTAEAEPLAVIEVKANTVPELTATTAEGALLTDDQAETVRGHYNKLSHNQRQWIAPIATDAQRGGAGFGMKETATHRRGFLVTALSKFAAEYVTDNADLDEADTMFRAVLALVVDGLAWSKHSIGAIVATLTAEQAQALSGCVNAVINQLFEMSFTDDGRPHFNQIEAA